MLLLLTGVFCVSLALFVEISNARVKYLPKDFYYILFPLSIIIIIMSILLLDVFYRVERWTQERQFIKRKMHHIN